MIVYVHTTTIYLLYAQTWIDRFPRGHLIRFKLLQDTSPSKWWNRLIPPMDQLAMAMASEDYSEVSYKWETLKNTSLRNEYCIFASHTIVSTYVYIYIHIVYSHVHSNTTPYSPHVYVGHIHDVGHIIVSPFIYTLWTTSTTYHVTIISIRSIGCMTPG